MNKRDFCLNCGHTHVKVCKKCNNEHAPDTKCQGTATTYNCNLYKSDWDCKCTEKDFVGRRFKGSFGA